MSRGPWSLTLACADRGRRLVTETSVTEQSAQRLAQFVVAEPRNQTLWETALRQLDDVAERIALDPSVHRVLRRPERELTVSVPVMMDGRIEVFI